MKKIILLAAILLFITGCGKEKLSCSKSETENGVENITTLNIESKKDKIYKINLELEMLLVDEEETSKEDFEFSTTVLKSFYENYVIDGIKLTDKLKEDKYTVKLEFNQETYSNLNKLMQVNLDSIAELKNNLESENYTCK